MPRQKTSAFDDPDGPGRRGRPRRRPPRAGRGGRPRSLLARITRWSAVAAVLVLTAALLGAYVKYRTVWDSIHRVAVTGLGKRPPSYDNALNVLVFGTDSRAGLSTQQQIKLHVGPNQGAENTDTVMLVHIAPGRHAVTVLSIPRDTQVPIYSCAGRGPSQPGQQQNLTASERINAVFAAGGVSCLWKTVEQQTGIRIDHFIELTFTGFVKVINDIGGVNVCVNQPVNNSVSGLILHRGVNHIQGVMALKFWRTRENIGMGTDPQRIARDQFLMASLLRGVKHSGVLTSPSRMLSMIQDVAAAMTTDRGMTASDLLQIAQSLRGISNGSVQFVTAPNAQDPNDNQVVDFLQPKAGEVFSAIAHDLKLPKPAKRVKRGHGHHTAQLVSVKPAHVKVEVLNGSGVAGIAGSTATSLAARGFTVLGTTDAANSGYTNSVVEYASSADLPAARTLAAQLSNVTLTRVASVTPGTVSLILGSSFTSLSSPAVAAQSVSSLSKKYQGITGSTSACRDSKAFAGPNGY